MKSDAHLEINSQTSKNEDISDNFKNINSIVGEIINNLKEDTDQSTKSEERTNEIIRVFSLINEDMETMKNEISDILDENSKEEFLEENKKLEISFKMDFSKIKNLQNKSEDKSTNEITLNKNDVKLISDHVKKEIELLNKEIIGQDKNIKLVKEGLAKIQNY
jgi:hypothetical protein